MTLEQRIARLKALHDRACMEVIDRLLRKREVAARGAADMAVAVFNSKSLAEADKLRIMDIACRAVGESALDLAD